MVAEDMGMTLMPELAVPTRTHKDDNIRYIQFNEPQPTRRIGMLYRKNSYRAEMFKLIGKIIKTTVRPE
ncbi:MAG: LysR substrate-binding domain-containing protein, partial [Gammaproteobacteria bacterium]|nr:LysR substrate-binding domain-containing protein [Gammaproteobacteria bacterium]